MDSFPYLHSVQVFLDQRKIGKNLEWVGKGNKNVQERDSGPGGKKEMLGKMKQLEGSFCKLQNVVCQW